MPVLPQHLLDEIELAFTQAMLGRRVLEINSVSDQIASRHNLDHTNRENVVNVLMHRAERAGVVIEFARRSAPSEQIPG